VPTLETPMSPGGSQASAGEGLSPCNIGIGIGKWLCFAFVRRTHRRHSIPADVCILHHVGVFLG